MAPLVRTLRRYCAATAAFPLYLGTASCAPITSEPPQNPSSVAQNSERKPARDVTDPAFPSAPLKVVYAKTLPITLSLPGPEHFIVAETKSTFSAVHPGTKSEIKVRLWTSSRLVSETQCEQELQRLDAKVVERERATRGAPAMTAQPFTPGPDYRGNVSSHVHAAPDGSIWGYVHGIAAGVGHCLSYDAQTQVTGPNAERKIAERLTSLLDDIALSVRLRDPESREPIKAR